MSDDTHAEGFSEIFQCTVQGADIVEARFNALTTLEAAIGVIPRHHWKLAQMQHSIAPADDGEGNTIAVVFCNAVWIHDPNSDGGKGFADILPTDPEGSDSIAPEKPKVTA